MLLWYPAFSSDKGHTELTVWMPVQQEAGSSNKSLKKKEALETIANPHRHLLSDPRRVFTYPLKDPLQGRVLRLCIVSMLDLIMPVATENTIRL